MANPSIGGSSYPVNPELYRKHIIEVLSLNSPSLKAGEVIDLTDIINKGEFINSGGYGEVYMGDWMRLSSEQKSLMPSVAIKVVRVTALREIDGQSKRIKVWQCQGGLFVTDFNMQQLRRELRVWQALENKNILPLIATACLDGNPNLPAIISPWMENGTIMDYIKRNPKIQRERCLLDIIQALNYLHRSTPYIVHGDLKAANVLVDHRGNLYVSDFGLSRILEDTSLWNTSATHAAGTTRWTAPEILKGDQNTVTRESDIYAFAMTCFEILSGHIPFHLIRNDGAVIMAVVFRNERPDQSLVPTVSRTVWKLLTMCWETDPSRRPDSRSIEDAMTRFLESPPAFTERKAMNLSTSLRRISFCKADSHFLINIDGVLSLGDYLTGSMSVLKANPPSSPWTNHGLYAKFSSDGSLIAISDWQGIQILKLASWESIFGFVVKSTNLWCALAFSPDGKWLACASSARQVQIRDSLSGRVVYEFEVPWSTRNDDICGITVSRCSSKLATIIYCEPEVVLWHVQTESFLCCFVRPGLSTSLAYCIDAVFSPTSDLLVVGYSDGVVVTWDTASFQVVRTMSLHSDPVHSLAISRDGMMIASASDDKIWLHNIDSGEPIGSPLVGHDDLVTSVHFSSDANRIVSGSWDGTVRVWEAPV